VIERKHMKRLIKVATEHGMDVGLTGSDVVKSELYLTWHGKPERLNEIVIRDYEGSLEAAAQILTRWIETRKETV
jgi:hypothetical protein